MTVLSGCRDVIAKKVTFSHNKCMGSYFGGIVISYVLGDLNNGNVLISNTLPLLSELHYDLDNDSVTRKQVPLHSKSQ